MKWKNPIKDNKIPFENQKHNETDGNEWNDRNVEFSQYQNQRKKWKKSPFLAHDIQAYLSYSRASFKAIWIYNTTFARCAEQPAHTKLAK